MSSRYYCGKTEQNPEQTIHRVFQLVLNRYGADVFTNPARLNAILADMAPQLPSQRWLVDVASKSGVYSAICHADQNELPYIVKHSVSILSSRYCLDPEKAEKAVFWLCEALYGDCTYLINASGSCSHTEISQGKGKKKKRRRWSLAVKAVAVCGIACIASVLVFHAESIPIPSGSSADISFSQDAQYDLTTATPDQIQQDSIKKQDPVMLTQEINGMGQETVIPEADMIVQPSEVQEPAGSTVSFDPLSFSPVFHYDFSTSLYEQYGQPETIHGSTQLVSVDGSTAAWFGGYGNYITTGTGFNYNENGTFNIVLKCTNVHKDYAAFFAKYETSREGPYAYAINQGRINLWWNETPEKYTELESRTVINENEWYDITVVKEGLHFQLYINGILDSEVTLSSIMRNRDEVTIGCQKLMFGDESQLFFEGYIRDIYIFDQAMSSEDVYNLSNMMLDDFNCW